MKSDNEHKFDTLRLSPKRFLFSISRADPNKTQPVFASLIWFTIFLFFLRWKSELKTVFALLWKFRRKRVEKFESIWMQMDSLGIIIIKPWKASLAHPDQTLSIIFELNPISSCSINWITKSDWGVSRNYGSVLDKHFSCRSKAWMEISRWILFRRQLIRCSSFHVPLLPADNTSHESDYFIADLVKFFIFIVFSSLPRSSGDQTVVACSIIKWVDTF